MKSQIRELIPRSVKQSLKVVAQERRLRWHWRNSGALKCNLLRMNLLVRCQEGWGDDDYPAIGGIYKTK